eukprot:TRINITY_DN3740_c0_g1_i1.p2 TRINITY_DN3740_c0_g1~~TRINITY_DN3740_c0_g1_i1.p2  ORF type:complete len:129 (+),score=4.51 TRINITY_DN3740_c0_g1_i1:194-580(+)
MVRVGSLLVICALVRGIAVGGRDVRAFLGRESDPGGGDANVLRAGRAGAFHGVAAACGTTAATACCARGVSATIFLLGVVYDVGGALIFLVVIGEVVVLGHQSVGRAAVAVRPRDLNVLVREVSETIL